MRYQDTRYLLCWWKSKIDRITSTTRTISNVVAGIRRYEHIETFLSDHPQIQFMFSNDIIRGKEYFMCATITCQHSKNKVKSIIVLDHYYTNAKYGRCSNNRHFEIYDGIFFFFIIY